MLKDTSNYRVVDNLKQQSMHARFPVNYNWHSIDFKFIPQMMPVYCVIIHQRVTRLKKVMEMRASRTNPDNKGRKNKCDWQWKGFQSAVKENRSYLRELGPVKGFVALEELSCQVAVLPVHFLQSGSMASMVQGEQHVVFNETKSEASFCVLSLLCTGFTPTPKKCTWKQ